MAKRLKGRIIRTFVLFTVLIAIGTSAGVYWELNATINDLSKSTINSNIKTMTNLLENSKKTGREIITDSNKKIINLTKNELNSFVKKATKDQNRSLLKLFGLSFEKEIDFSRRELESTASKAEFRWGKDKESKLELKRLMKNSKFYRGFSVYGKENFELYSIGKVNRGYSLGKIKSQVRSGAIFYGDSKKKDIIYMGIPIYSDEKKVIGLLVAEIDSQKVLESIIKDINLGKGKTVYVIDYSGKIVKHKNWKLDGTKFKKAKYSKSKEFQQIIIKPNMYTLFRKKVKGISYFFVVEEKVLGNYNYVEELEAKTKATIEQSFKNFDVEIRSKVTESFEKTYSETSSKMNEIEKKLFYIFAYVIALGVLISLWFGVVVGRGVVKPIKEISFAFRKLKEGDYDYKFDKKMLKLNDEVGEIVNLFVDVREKFKLDIITARDDERQKAYEERSGATEQVVMGIVHEMRAPLNKIKEESEIIWKNTDDPRIKVNSKEVLNECEKLKQFSLDLTLLGSREEFALERFGIGIIIDGIWDKLKLKISGKKIEFTTEIPETLPSIQGNKSKIAQLIGSIVLNAIEAIDVKESRIHIKVEKVENDLVVSIVNNGPKIAKEIEDKIFMPFVSNKKGGKGLGLTMGRKIAEGHGGEINFSSSDAETEFVVRLPIKRNEE